jgi:hypothetical protein
MRLALLLLALLSLVFAGAAQAAQWSSAGSMATARDFHDATLLDDGRVLVSGGRDGSGELRSAELFDPATGSWSSAGAMAGQRGSFTTTMLAGGRVLAVGGWGGVGTTGFLRGAEVYDPAANAWTEAASMNGQRGHHAAATLADGRILVTGGLGAYGALTATAEVYAPDADEWAAAPEMAEARFWHTATALPGGKVLVAGGGGRDGSLASAELYDPETSTWSSAASMSAARVNHTATALPDGRVLVAGGAPTSGGALGGAELYDPATGEWSSAGSMATGRFWHTATLLPDGKVLVAGGDDGSGSVTGTELYDPGTNSWSSAGSMAGDRSMHAAAALADGRVLVVGGSSGLSGAGNSKRLASAEVYGEPPSAPADSSPPTVVIRQGRAGVRRDRTAIRFECRGEPGSRCTGTLTLRATGNGVRKTTSVKKAFDLAAGAARTLTVRVPAPTRAQLARRRSATVRAVARSAAGAKPVARTLTLVRR